MKRIWLIEGIFWLLLQNSTVFAACVPAGTAGDDNVVCTGTINSFQYFYGGSDTVTLNGVVDITYYNSYWLDESLGGNPATDGNDTFVSNASRFYWVLGFGGDDRFEVYDSQFNNLYADTNPGHGVSQRGNDTIYIENSHSYGWILGGNDNDTITIKDSNVSFVAAGYSDIYGTTDYTPYDGNDTVVLDHASFTAVNYAYPGRPGAVEGGKQDDTITFINGGVAFNVTGGHGNDLITLNDSVLFSPCSFVNDLGNMVDCGIYGDEPYLSEYNVSLIPMRHGDDEIILNSADLSGTLVHGGDGSDRVVVYTPVILTGTTLDGGDDRYIADTFIDLIQFEQWMGDLNGSQFHNWEQIRLYDASMITLLDSNISAGADNGIDLLSGLPYGLIIDDRSQLNLYHNFLIDANLHNHAILNLQDGNTPGIVITVNNDYTATAGELYLDTVLNDAAPSISDRLVIAGDTSGDTVLHISNIGGTGGQTSTTDNSGILLIEVRGVSIGTFALDAPLQTADYWYHLVKGSNGNWYLQSEMKVAAFTVSKSTASTPAAAGDTLDYRFTVTNTGNVTLHALSLSDAKCSSTPAYSSGDSSGDTAALVPGESQIYSCLSIAVTQREIDSGSVYNAVSVTAQSPDGTTTPAVEANHTVAVTAQPNLHAVKTMTGNADEDGSGDITLYDTLSYEIHATNTGNVTLHDVHISDSMITPDSVLCTVLLPGDSCILRGDYTVAAADIDAGKIENTATVASAATLTLHSSSVVSTGSYARPIAVDDSNSTVTSYAPYILDVLANDIWDRTHCNLTQLDYTQPPNGTVTLDDAGTPNDPSDDRLIYTPKADLNDITESFTYTITDCVGQSDSAEVSIQVACASSQTSDGGDALTLFGVLGLSLLMFFTGLYAMQREMEYV